MAGSPVFKVYSSEGLYIAACKHAEDAAAIIAMRGEGATIRYQHGKVLWKEGSEVQPAGESYDLVSDTVNGRLQAHHADNHKKVYFGGGK